MTSPAINGQKDKTESTSASEDVNNTARVNNTEESQTERNTSPLIAWWRIFKLANLLMQQGC